MLELILTMLLVSMLSIALFLLAPMDFAKECIVWNTFDENNEIKKALPDGSVQQAKTGDCKEPVVDGLLGNLILHAPWVYWIALVATGCGFVYTLLVPGGRIVLYVMGHYEDKQESDHKQ